MNLIFLRILLLIGHPLRAGCPLLNLTDVIIVLGTKVHADGTPSDALVRRMDYGVDLYKQGLSNSGRLLLSGKGKGLVEANIMAQIAEGLGIPVEALILEKNSLRTIDNVYNCKKIMDDNGWSSAIIVTSPYHVKRATISFSRIGIRAVGVEAFAPEEYPINSHIKVLFHEYVAWFKWILESIIAAICMYR